MTINKQDLLLSYLNRDLFSFTFKLCKICNIKTDNDFLILPIFCNTCLTTGLSIHCGTERSS